MTDFTYNSNRHGLSASGRVGQRVRLAAFLSVLVVAGLAVLEPAQVVWFQQKVSEVEVEDSLVGYVMDIVQRTRVDARLQMGVSPRGAIGLLGASRAYALLSGRDFLVPSDVQKLAMPCLAHRILPVGSTAASHEAHEETGAIVQDILQDVAVPV